MCEKDAAYQDADNQHPVVRKEPAHRHQGDGRPGERLFHTGKHGRYFRHHEGHQEEQHGDADNQHNGRVENRVGDLVLEGQLFLEKLREAEQDLVECSAGLSGPYHVHINRGEILLVGLQHGAQRFSAPNLLPDVGKERLHRFLFSLIDQDSERFDQRQPRNQQRRKLSGH